MSRAVLIIPTIIILALSCSKGLDKPVPPPERELSVPEKVEKELADVLSKDWKSLSDTLEYFYSTMLSKGKCKGIAPDGVFYELDIRGKDGPALEAEFRIEDSTWAAVNGNIRPLEIKLLAFDTEIAIKKELRDGTSLTVSKVKVIAPLCFLFEDRHQAPPCFTKDAAWDTLHVKNSRIPTTAPARISLRIIMMTRALSRYSTMGLRT